MFKSIQHLHTLKLIQKSFWTCNVCNKFYTNLNPFYCSHCNFYFCQNCYFLEESNKPYLQHSYQLSNNILNTNSIFHEHLLKIEKIDNDWVCNLCNLVYDKDEETFCCKNCNYYICKNCFFNPLFLTPTIKLINIHPHILKNIFYQEPRLCDICHKNNSHLLSCNECNFIICINCLYSKINEIGSENSEYEEIINPNENQILINSIEENNNENENIYNEIPLYNSLDDNLLNPIEYQYENNGNNDNYYNFNLFNPSENLIDNDLNYLLNDININDNENNINGIDEELINLLPIKEIKDINKIPEDKKNCRICMENFVINDEIMVLPCLHEYHKNCIEKWFKFASTCPLCKYDLKYIN